MNLSTNINEIRSIRAALERLAGMQLTGTQIRALIDITCPGFDIRAAAGVPAGSGAQSVFLKTHFADIVHIVGKKGGDNVYLIGAPRSDPAVGIAPSSSSLWAAFASARLGQGVVFDREDHSLSIQAKGAVSAHQVHLAAVSPQEFRKIAAQFIESAPADIQDELQRTLEQGDNFYDSWITVIKASNPGLYHRWGLFRVQAVVDLFRERLVMADVPPQDVEKAVQLLAADQAAAYRLRSSAIRNSVQPSDRPSLQMAAQAAPRVFDTVDVSDAKTMAILTIKSMSITEIRQMSVPFGAVIDAALLSRK